MSERIPIAIVGCGGMGRRHLRGLVHLARSSFGNVDLVAVADLNQENANFMADEAGELLGHRPRVYRDVAEFASDVQAVFITTDAGSHHRVAVPCLAAGLHVLCEKPLGLTIRACDQIVAAANRAGRHVSVGENYRRDPINRLAQAVIRDGGLGEPRLMIETSIGGKSNIAITPWRHMKNTGSITIDAGIHYADILRFYMGEVQNVYGETRLHEKVRYNSGGAGPGGFYARWSQDFPEHIEPTGEDALYAHLTFASGAIGHWIYDHAGHGKPARARQVFGSRASLDCPGDRNGRPLVLHLDDGTDITDARVLEFAPSYHLDPLAAELFGGERVWTYDFEFNDTDSRLLALEYYELGQCALTGRQPEVTAEEGRADLALTYAPFEAGLLGRPVSLREVIDGSVDTYQREIDAALGLVEATA
ncbi:MAG: Gfo/Idh/MocA family oxidoreductase [Chloroflexi bacterium]|nr:Gfo/Idh/MocA family oxidoreductase [Chloroflexota bacterium]